MFYYLTANDARVRDNVDFVREPDNSFNPKCVKFGLSWDSCVYIYFLSLRGQSRIL